MTQTIMNSNLNKETGLPGTVGMLLAGITGWHLQIIERRVIRLLHSCDWSQDYATDVNLVMVVTAALKHDAVCL